VSRAVRSSFWKLPAPLHCHPPKGGRVPSLPSQSCNELRVWSDRTAFDDALFVRNQRGRFGRRNCDQGTGDAGDAWVEERSVMKAAILNAAGLFVTSCGGTKTVDAAKSTGPSSSSILTVTAVQAVTRPISASVQVTGSFVAMELSDVAPEAAGRVV